MATADWSIRTATDINEFFDILKKNSILNLKNTFLISQYTIKSSIQKWSSIEDDVDLSQLLHTHKNNLYLQSIQPRYHVYEIPKKNGKLRLIEDPHIDLKKIQRGINKALQSIYYPLRPKAVYGFCISLRNDEDLNVINNARRHMGNDYMLNIDLKDFFHTISHSMIKKIMIDTFKKMKNQTIDLMCNLCCYRNRLPMGAPTSPILSNFAMLDLDAELENYASCAKIVYTRYADDLTFSSINPISSNDFKFIQSAIHQYRFEINPQKVRNYGLSDTKIVTGLEVYKDKVTLPENYIWQLVEEVERYQLVKAVDVRYRTGMSLKKLKLFKQELLGKWNFAYQVLGHDDKLYKIREQIENNNAIIEKFESMDWLDIPYQT